MKATSVTPAESDIAVIGMAGRFPGARNVDEFWRNLRDGIESITWFTNGELRAAGVDASVLTDPAYVKAGFVLPDMETFDAGFFGFNPREAAIMDPQHRHFLECAWEALEHAGHMPERFEGSIGVFAGCGMNTHFIFNLLSNPELVQAVGYWLLRHTGNDKDFLTTRVSHLLNLKGPSVNVQTACSTSLVAIHLAAQSLLNRECDMALAGGVTIRQPHRVGYLYKAGEILSPDGHCRAFDARAAGTVLGGGVGIVVLRRLIDALADGDSIQAVIKGSAINNDGAMKFSYLAPSVDGQAQAVAEALSVTGVPPETISYIETFGAGTPVGDSIEIAALVEAFSAATKKKQFCAVGSVKTNIGHLDTAAGVAGLIKVVLSMQHRQLPPSLHYAAPNPEFDLANSPFYVNAKLEDWNPEGALRRAGVSAFGAGGTNAHVVLEEAPMLGAPESSRPAQLLILSGKTPLALEAATRNLSAHLRVHPDLDLADVAYTLQVGRRAFGERRVVVCDSLQDAADALEQVNPHRVESKLASDGKRRVAFMFAGGGAQYAGMGADLYRTEPLFRDEVDRCLSLLTPGLRLNLKHLLYPPTPDRDTARELERPSLALPALFLTQYAQARLWISWGVKPAAMIGHGMGEYTAACLSGVLSLEDALSLVALRGQLFERLPEGGMLSVPLSEHELLTLMSRDLSVAAVNGPSLCVASGPARAVDELRAMLASQGVESQRIPIAVAAHSGMIDSVLDEFGRHLQGIPLRAPTIPFASNLSGAWITPQEAMDPKYWVTQLRQTVRFADGVQKLLEDPDMILLEVGPGTLSTFTRLHPAKRPSHEFLTSLPHPDEERLDVRFMLQVLGRLWLGGVDVNWSAFHAPERRRRVPLPTYPFERQRHWIEPGMPAAVPGDPRPDVRKPDLGDWFYQPCWRPRALPAIQTPPADPARVLVFGTDDGFVSHLVRRLRESGRDVVVAHAGDRFDRRPDGDYTIRPAERRDYDSLLVDLAAQARIPDKIFHLWNVSGESRQGSRLIGLDRALATGFYSLLFLAQAIGSQDLSAPLDLLVASSGMQRAGGTPVSAPERAILLGPCKVIPKEFLNITCRSIDLEHGTDDALAIDHLLAELAAPFTDQVIAYRRGSRLVQTYEPFRIEEPVGLLSRLRDGGTYLITGGLGGIGLVVAHHLASTIKVRLVLVGRTGLPDRRHWESWLEVHDASDLISQRIRKVMALEALGADVLIAPADVTDPAQMQEVVRRTQARFGGLHGVIHAAGILNDGLIQLKTPEDAAGVLAPKVNGSLVLHEVLAGERLEPDFFVLFSSRSAIAGLAGRVDYAAANAFLGAFAHHRTARGAPFSVAIHWSAWRELGMTADLAPQPATNFDEAIASEEGVEAFRRIMSAGLPPEVVVSPHDLDAWLRRASAPTPAPSPERAAPSVDVARIESAVRDHEAVREAAVQAHRGASKVRIVAHVVYNQEHHVTTSELRKHLRSRLPEELVPHHFLELDALPRTASGSVDRAALEDPFAPEDDHVAPRTPTEALIADIWKEFLGIDRVSMHDNFLDIGGHSLLAVRVLARIQKCTGVRLSPSVMKLHTLEQIAAECDDKMGTAADPARSR